MVANSARPHWTVDYGIPHGNTTTLAAILSCRSWHLRISHTMLNASSPERWRRAHLLGFAVLMVINIRNMKSKKEEHCSPARTLQEFLYMNAFFVSVRILWPGYDLSSRSRRTNALASLAPRLASRALTPWWVQRKAKTGESTTVPGLSFWRSTDLFIIFAIPHQLCSSFPHRISFLLLGQLYAV